jgi:hypothetical protein
MKLKQFGQARAGTAALVVIAIALVGLAAYTVMSTLNDGTPDDIHYTTYICTEAGKPFRHKNRAGETHPIQSPYSGKATGVIAEPCYWTADGGMKSEPTWVLLNELVGKSGPTFCPDCGRLVVGHNPRPGAGVHPPARRQEYTVRQDKRSTARDVRDGDR